MDPLVAPRPTTTLVEASKTLSAKERAVFEQLQQHPEGMQVAGLARALGMHENTVRGHLEELLTAGVVTRHSVASAGRGRPSHLYTARVPRIDRAATAFIALVEVLASMVAEDDVTQARNLGREWARRSHEIFALEPQDTMPEILARSMVVLRDMGFDPELRAYGTGSEIRLRACPFVTRDGTPPLAVVCALHAGFVDGGAEGHNVEVLPLELPGQCCVRMNPCTRQ